MFTDLWLNLLEEKMLRNGFLTFFLLVITAKESIQLCEESVTLDSPIVNSVVDNAGSFCNPYQRTYSRAIEGRTVFRADGISVTPARCNVYNGTSNASEPLGAITDGAVCWVEIPDDVVLFTVQCFDIYSSQRFICQTANFTTEEIDFDSSATVSSANYPSNYPSEHLQETIIRSNEVVEFTITFLEPILFDRAEVLCIKFDDGTELPYADVVIAPDPIIKNASEITIQFSTNENEEFTGFSLDIRGPLPEITCTSQGTTDISINGDTLKTLSCSDPGDYLYISPIPVDNLTTLDPACVANSSFPNFDLQFSDCSSIQQTNYTITVVSTVRCQQNLSMAAIQRFEDKCINFTCEYNVTELWSTSGIIPKVMKVILDGVQATGTFPVKLIFTDDTYSSELAGDRVVTVPDFVNAKVELSLPGNNNSFFVQVTRCWATQDAHFSDPSYSIIHDSCEDLNSFDPPDAKEIDTNYDANFAAFKFRSFVWTGAIEEEIYLHCEVTLCFNSDDDPCPPRPSCAKKRRRRDSVDDGFKSRVISTSQPLRIRQNEKESCEKENGGCSDVCEMRSADVMCLCYVGRKLAKDGKSCQDKASEVLEIREANDQSNVLLALVMIATVICALGLVLKLKGNGKTLLNLA
ncbi:unnamed protein product [Clavelina lepadiformis]|uniref:ZP domain-containing protein n=1 Tax=Clavelina lepadiformis TaxID=159417 RepID=A0ABP0FYX3_CLALP